MKYKVATVSSSSLNALIGPSRNIRRIYENRQLFEDSNIELMGPYCPVLASANTVAGSIPIRFVLKRTLKSVLKTTTKGSWLLYKITYVRNAQCAIKKYANDDTDNDADLIVFRDADSAYEYLKKDNRKPYIFVLHSNGTNDMFFSGSAFPKLRKIKYQSIINSKFEAVCSNASGLFFLSPKAISNFKNRYPKVNTIFGYYHQGLNKPKVTKRLPKSDLLTFVCVGTICERKNQRSLIEAFAVANTDKARLVLVGDGEDSAYCQKIAVNLGVSKKIEFLGPQEDVGNILSVSDVFIMVSHNEGVPNAAVEAMSFGLPLVLTDVGACGDLIDGNGCLIKPSINEIVNAINLIVSQYKADKLERFRERSQEIYHEYYTEEIMCKEHIEMYKKVILKNSNK